MKKLISIIVAFVIILSSFVCINAFADYNIKIIIRELQ